ncbi:LysR family transcriptional regulator [Rhodoferax koreense]|uniref:LysR family transcriptional regulator n=1 Tax=Rhodoferax koreensis TaxID=1842727 RepID=A0A1P8JSV4_9BURK|nr:LysR family transcriptional regulator [Rhodoferax koreense]APW36842.1 LysR family transcriptional regulator [Rhodoferax koreense]
MGPVNRPLDLEWLEDFLALTETGNFSRAAQARNIAQPAFSRHIRSLEEWAGVELIDRSQHPASATPAGEIIMDVARDVVLRLSQAHARAHEAHEQAGRSLRFAATHVLSLAFFPGWLQQIEQQLTTQLGPIHMVSDSFKVCEELMLQRRVQFFLCYGHASVATRLLAPDFEFTCIGADRLVPVSAPDAEGKAQHAIHGDHTPLPMLAYSDESWLGQIMRVRMAQVFDPARFKPVVTSHHTGLLKNLALGGRGLGWLPLSLVSAELADGRLVMATPEDDAGWQLPVEIHLFRAKAAQTAMAEALWRVAGNAAG